MKKKGVNGFFSLFGGCVHTLKRHIYMQKHHIRQFCIWWPL